jgi:hypothetical protein
MMNTVFYNIVNSILYTLDNQYGCCNVINPKRTHAALLTDREWAGYPFLGDEYNSIIIKQENT